MCGRYASSHDPTDIAAEFDIEQAELPRIDPDWNVAPTKEVYVVVERPDRGGDDPTPKRQLRVMTWGLVPFWSKNADSASRMINARMETIAEKPAFRRAFRQRRALIPADGYYEWYESKARTSTGKPVKHPYFVRPRGDELLAMAGLYEIWRDPAKSDDDPMRFRWTMTVITTAAEDELGRIHERMPLIRHIQLADVPGRHEPGTGEINFPFLFRTLDELGYDGWVGCEYIPLGDTVAGLGWRERL